MSVREAIKNKWSVVHASFRRLVILFSYDD